VSPAVSIVIPTLADRELLAACLDDLRVELAARDSRDEVIVVDDSGDMQLRGWCAANYPEVEYVGHEANLGFAAALASGVHTARHALVFALNPDVRVRVGCLDALVETLADDVHAVSPYALLFGAAPAEESLPELITEDGFPVIRLAAIEVEPGSVVSDHPDGVPVAFALGGASLFRRDDFLQAPFDPRFEPFYWEDVDWCQSALRRGRRVLVDPRAVVEHHHRGTIGARIPDKLVRAAIEKNRLLFAWKHYDSPELLREHLAALAARILEHGICEEREELIWFLLALEDTGLAVR